MVLPIRLGALALGLVCSCLGMFGAFEFDMKLEGGVVTYLVLAAPVIAVATEMALCVLTYNLTRVLNIVGVENLMEAIKA